MCGQVVVSEHSEIFLFSCRCYACDDEVPAEPDSSVQKCIKLLLKAMNLTPPAGNSNSYDIKLVKSN
mgnify:CR=1 FL=1